MPIQSFQTQSLIYKAITCQPPERSQTTGERRVGVLLICFLGGLGCLRQIPVKGSRSDISNSPEPY